MREESESVPQTSGCNRKRSVADSEETSTSNVHISCISSPNYLQAKSTTSYRLLTSRCQTIAVIFLSSTLFSFHLRQRVFWCQFAYWLISFMQRVYYKVCTNCHEIVGKHSLVVLDYWAVV